VATGKAFELKGLTVGEIRSLVDVAEDELQSRKKDTVKKLRTRFKKEAEKEGVTLAEVVGIAKGRRKKASGTRKPVAPKFRGPKGELWSGRGKTPSWMSALISKGRKKDEFLIRDKLTTGATKGTAKK